MASYVASLFVPLIVVLACQVTTGRKLIRESRSDEEAATKYSDYAETEESDQGKWLNEMEEAYGTGDTQRDSKESNVELVSKHFDTSPLTLNKFMGKNSNPNEANRHASGVSDFTDSGNSRMKIQESAEESGPRYSASSESVNKDANGNESNEENSESREKYKARKRDWNDCKKVCRMAALRNIPTEENISISPEGVNSSTKIKSFNDTEKLSTPSRMRAATKLFDPSMPSDSQDATEHEETKHHLNSRRTILPMFASLYKKLIPFVPKISNVMEGKSVIGGILSGGVESDALTSNTGSQITAGRENNNWSQHGASLLGSVGTLNAADSEKINNSMKIYLDNVANANGGQPIFQNTRDTQAPQLRLYADDTENRKREGGEREVQKYLKKTNERLLNIIINNYPPQACDEGKM